MTSTATDLRQQSTAYAPALESNSEGFPSPRHFRWIVTLLLAYFGARLLFFVLQISPAVPPDETTHFGICTIFSRVFLFPVNSSESYQYGLVTNIPWLYYWIMGKLLALNFFGISDLVFLRLLNIPLAFAFVGYVLRTLRLLTDDRLSQMLLVVAMTNTMMLSFLSAFVSYDNLTNLLAAMAIYYLLAFFSERSGALLAASILCQLAGSLTKITFLPLVLILAIVLFVHEARNIRIFPAAFKTYLRISGRRGLGLMLVLLFFLALNIQLYGGNYLRYNALTPVITDVLSRDNAMQYRLAAKAYIFNLFREERITKEQALAMTARISHPVDRANAVYLIENYAEFKKSGFRTYGLLTYIPWWLERMAAGIFGIFAHLVMPNYGWTVVPIAFLAGVTGIAFLVRWRPWKAEERLSAYLAVIAGFYGVFLLYAVNYREYLGTGLPDEAVHGRYIFPVIGPIYLLSSLYLLRLCKGRLIRLGIFAASAFIFIVSDFPLFLCRVTPEWFVWPKG